MAKAAQAVQPAHDNLPTQPAFDYESHAGEGMEDVKSTDLSMPQWKLLQSGSPECKRLDQSYIPGAAEGRWCDSIRREVCDKFHFVPAVFHTRHVEWQPRETGGGFVRDHGLSDACLQGTVNDEVGRWRTKDNTIIVPTPTWYGIVCKTIDGTEEKERRFKGVLFFVATATKASRTWLNGATSIELPKKDGTGYFTPPLYYMAYEIGAVSQSNDKGTWSIPMINRLGPTETLYPWAAEMAHDFRGIIHSSSFQAPRPQREASPAANGPVDVVIDDEIPF